MSHNRKASDYGFRGSDFYVYRGFDIVSRGSICFIYERGKLIDDAASEEAAEDRVNLILLNRRSEDQAEITRDYGRLA